MWLHSPRLAGWYTEGRSPASLLHLSETISESMASGQGVLGVVGGVLQLDTGKPEEAHREGKVKKVREKATRVSGIRAF